MMYIPKIQTIVIMNTITTAIIPSVNELKPSSRHKSPSFKNPLVMSHQSRAITNSNAAAIAVAIVNFISLILTINLHQTYHKYTLIL